LPDGNGTLPGSWPRVARTAFIRYYYASAEAFIIGTSISALVERGAPVDLDLAGLAAFLHLGFFLREDTPFKAIRAMPPSGRLEWAPGAGVSVEPDPMMPAAGTMSRPEAIQAYTAAVRHAIDTARPRGARSPCR
jgi:asparagine synthase (glutamine-hydrolysing)